MLRTSLFVVFSLAACVPPSQTAGPVFVGGTSPPAAQRGASMGHTMAVRGRIPRGKHVDYIVAIQIDHTGKRQRIRIRPGADGSYNLQLPQGHRYAMAYEDGGRIVGNVSFPTKTGHPSQVINVSQNVVVNQQYVDLGEPTYVGGVYIAANDPGIYMDSDGDGIADVQDDDIDADDAIAAVDASAWQGDFDDVDEDSGSGDEVQD